MFSSIALAVSANPFVASALLKKVHGEINYHRTCGGDTAVTQGLQHIQHGRHFARPTT
jgi:hypothetical protein